MIIYTIGTATHQNYGHGDSGTELRICPQGMYGSDGFPPAFTTKEAAQQYLDALQWSSDKRVVELELREAV